MIADAKKKKDETRPSEIEIWTGSEAVFYSEKNQAKYTSKISDT